MHLSNKNWLIMTYKDNVEANVKFIYLNYELTYANAFHFVQLVVQQ